MIKAIIFDFFGVVRSDEYWRFVHEDKNQPGPFNSLAEKVNLGELNWPDYIREVANATGKSAEEVNAMYRSEQINMPLIELIKRLHGQYKIGLLSNASSEYVRSLLKESKIEALFDAIILSSEVRITKPNPEIYKMVCERLGANLTDVLFVDDKCIYVQSAKSLGMEALLYEGFPSFKKELETILAPRADN